MRTCPPQRRRRRRGRDLSAGPALRCAAAVAVLAAAGCGGCSSRLGGPGDAPDADAADAAGPDAEVGPPPVCQIAVDCGGQSIPDEPKLTCTIRIDDGAGGTAYEGPVGIERRGRTSVGFVKPQYAIELRDGSGADAAVGLFGMGREADWILNGLYIDRSLIRTKLLYDLYRSLGGPERWAAESRYCELELDDDYRGVYLLSERVERDDDRLAIGVATDAGASFILKQDPDDGLEPIEIAANNWQLVYPRAELATPAQEAGIHDVLEAWRDAVQDGTGGDDVFDWVDLESAVDFVLLQELVRGHDAYDVSLHVVRDAGGPIRFVPWDMDLTIGQPVYNDSTETDGWIVYRWPMIQVMADDPRFADRLLERWTELREGPFAAAALQARIDEQLAILGDRVAANFARWPFEDIQFFDDLLPPREDHAAEIAMMRSWFVNRLVWMDANLADFAAGN